MKLSPLHRQRSPIVARAFGIFTVTLCAAMLGATLVALTATVYAAPAHAAETSSAPATGPAPDPAALDAPRWSVEPIAADPASRRSWFVVTAAPGQRVEDAVTITNLSPQPLTLQVYATDAFNTADGGFALRTAGRKPNDAGAWITMGAATVALEPGEAKDIPYTMDVPSDATPGDHAAGIVASMVVASQPVPGEPAVNVDQRVGVRMYVRVDGPIRPALDVTNVEVFYDKPLNPFTQGDMVVRYEVRNIGNLRIGSVARVQVHGPFGWELADAKTKKLPDILPRSTIVLTQRFADIPPAVRLTVDVDVAAAQTASANAPPTAVFAQKIGASRSTSIWAIPWALVGALALVALALFGRRIIDSWADRRQATRRAASRAPTSTTRPRGNGRGTAPPRVDESERV
jgi:hypothetical protein